MLKSAVRIAARQSATRVLPKPHAARRFINTAPPHQTSRSWRNSAARWGLAGALVYYYNTASVFAEEPAYAVHAPPETSQERERMQTVEAISEQRRARTKAEVAPPSSQDHPTAVTTAAPDAETTVSGSPEALEEEAEQQGAFNEETGEINWDCPCLGGMAYGPCGEQFRAAFSCFVFSKEEPKGVDCIENFKAMQNCFRDHPGVYGSELEDDEEAEMDTQGESVTAAARQPANGGDARSTESQAGLGAQDETKQSQAIDSTPSAPSAPAQSAPPAPQQDLVQRNRPEESGETLVPKQWHDSK